MTHFPPPQAIQNLLTAYFWHGDVLRSRSVSDVVLTGTLDVPAPPARLLADWERDVRSRLGLEPGDVEPLPLPRARMRWPDYARCVQAVTDWTGTLGLPGVLAASDIALMACRGAHYHHDGAQYGGAAFCNLFLGEDQGLDLHFPGANRRLPLTRGTAVVFDTGQPHAVIRRGATGFDAADFTPDQGGTLVFLTWELDLEDVRVGHALQLAFDTDPSPALPPEDAQVRRNGEPVVVCPASGRWLRAG